jgi:phage terminase Nu1 subunit (DNA packaging protein)
VGYSVNKKQLSDIFGVSERTLTDWQQKGMPVKINADRGKSNLYETADVIAWRIGFLVDGEKTVTARERNELACAKIKEIELARLVGDFLKTEDVEFAFGSIITAVRSEFLGGPRKLKSEINKEYGIDVDLRFIQKPFNRVLDRLARFSIDGEQDDPETDGEVSTAGTD